MTPEQIEAAWVRYRQLNSREGTTVNALTRARLAARS